MGIETLQNLSNTSVPYTVFYLKKIVWLWTISYRATSRLSQHCHAPNGCFLPPTFIHALWNLIVVGKVANGSLTPPPPFLKVSVFIQFEGEWYCLKLHFNFYLKPEKHNTTYMIVNYHVFFTDKDSNTTQCLSMEISSSSKQNWIIIALLTVTAVFVILSISYAIVQIFDKHVHREDIV